MAGKRIQFLTEGPQYGPSDIYDILSEMPDPETVKQKKGKEYIEYLNLSCAFDIEVTSFYEGEGKDAEKRACMYIWMLGLHGRVIVGRTWDEFMQVCSVITERWKLSPSRRCMIFVHNLAYEFTFLSHRFMWNNVFALEERKVCYAVTNTGIEFRCSYILSGYSLASLGRNLVKYPVQKMVGDLDYDLLRNSETVMTEKELKYCENDVRVVMAYIQEQIEVEKWKITGIQLTKTAYVRRYCRKECLPPKHAEQYRALMKSLILSDNEYRLMRRCFQGGYTHANPVYVGRTMRDIHSIDFTSSYSAVMVAYDRFPMGRGQRYRPKDKSDFEYQISKYACMFDIEILDVKQKRRAPDSYLSRSRCQICEDAALNNGRVYGASRVVTTMTEIDWQIFEEVYDHGMFRILMMYRYPRGYLPTALVKSILKLYQDKTKLKGVPGEEINYQLSKGMLNSTFGCTVQDPCREVIEFAEDTGWGHHPCDISEALDKYNDSFSRFLFYGWGIYVTALARLNLWRGILEVGQDDYVYTDTDSIKLRNYEAHRAYVEKYDNYITGKIKAALQAHRLPTEAACPCTIKGKQKPLGVWDYEGKYDRFKTLGAKRYMVQDGDGLSITVSGVNKRCAVPYLIQPEPYKAQPIDRIFDSFSDELFIPDEYTGKKIHSYIEIPTEGDLTDYQGHTAHYSEYGSVHLEGTSYDFSMTQEFLNFLQDIQEDYYNGDNEIIS